ncbi:MAG: STAS domain-containing protein [Anaerolineales bacterium]
MTRTTRTSLKRCDLITLEGRYDSQSAPELEKALRESMDAGVYRIVLDVSQVTFFGSAAIRVLIMAIKECRRFNRGDVRLASVNDRMRQVLEMAGILPLIKIYDNATLAVGSF